MSSSWNRFGRLTPIWASWPRTARFSTDAVLATPRLGLINVHASLLPKYRGAAPIHRAIMAGESETGVTIMRVVKALDAGPMIATVSRKIDPNETSIDVERDLARLGAKTLVESVDAIADGRASETPQDDSQATYASKLEKIDGIVDWSRSAIEIHNQIRGLHPWPHAFSDLDGERTILLKSEVERGDPAARSRQESILEAHADRSERADRRRRSPSATLATRRAPADVGSGISGRTPHSSPAHAFFALSRVMIAPARTAAFTALCEVAAGRLDLPAALTLVRPTLQDERDRALATDLVTGTLRWQRQLDHLITEFSKRPLSKLDFQVLQILRLGAYQLIHLDRVPAAAAVNDAVAMTRRARKTSAAGLVNAVLRGISRNTHRLPLPRRPPEGDALHYLEISLSHPRWLADRWLDALRLRGRRTMGDL